MASLDQDIMFEGCLLLSRFILFPKFTCDLHNTNKTDEDVFKHVSNKKTNRQKQ